MMFKADKEQSLKAAKQFIYPVLIFKYGNDAEILSIEEIESTLAQRLDSAGNDILVTADDMTTTINSRCHNWQGFLTFTIRQTRHGTLSEYDRIKKIWSVAALYLSFLRSAIRKAIMQKLDLLRQKSFLTLLLITSTIIKLVRAKMVTLTFYSLTGNI